MLLEATDLVRHYSLRGLALGSGATTIIKGISLAVERGAAFGIAGPSGAGKSTLLRLLLALERPDEGTVSFDGIPISRLRPAVLRPLRKRFQAVFQDFSGSLNPRLTVATIIAEPLLAHCRMTAPERAARVNELLRLVGLEEDAASRRPPAFSGGQRQRVAIARALACNPELLFLDEPVSSLDAVLRHGVLTLLEQLRRTLGLTLVVVSHDLRTLARMCNRLAVISHGIKVEEGSTSTVLTNPVHPTTQQLVAAAAAATSLPKPASC